MGGNRLTSWLASHRPRLSQWLAARDSIRSPVRTAIIERSFDDYELWRRIAPRCDELATVYRERFPRHPPVAVDSRNTP